MADQSADGPTKLDTATRLAYDRTQLACNRTLMAVIRTAASLITFGFTIHKFFQDGISGRNLKGELIGPSEFGLMMICVGLLALLIGTFQHRGAINEMRKVYPDMRRSTVGVITSLIAALGILALLVVIFRL
jgi:putative membrane protein